MSTVQDIVNDIEALKQPIRQYISYDFFALGLLSKTIKNFEEAQILLRKGTSESTKESLVKMKTVKETLWPYVSWVPEDMRTFALEWMKGLDSIIEKIGQL